jgi:peroxiredoxin
VLLPLTAVLALASSVLAAPTVGSKAPDLTAKELTGKPFRLSQFRGQSPVIVNFFSTT